CDERRLETGQWSGLRHRQLAKAAGNSYSPGPVATAPVVDSTRDSESWVALAKQIGRSSAEA
ncbi:MAG: hypothetical protein QNJ82_16610, partial [Gammaproteobacteria bacterium]|nr:hypothetical protein [Gammaproteobacteria bacterium]